MRHLRGFQYLLIVAGIVLTAWTARLMAQSATGSEAPAKQPFSTKASPPPAPGLGSGPDDSRTVIPADLFVDDDNSGTQDGTAKHPYKTVQRAVDAADPASPCDLEPAPNGGRANLGADANTEHASKSDP